MTMLRRVAFALGLLAAALCGSLLLGEVHASYAPPERFGMCDGRLTLSTGVPVTTTDVTAATAVKFTPFHGNRCPAFVGGQWAPRTFAELSVSVPATTASNYDVFAYDNAGTLALELSSAWTSDTARFGSGTYATLLPTQDGVYVKSTNGTAIDATRRYLGSFRTTGVSGQTEDSLAKRYVWNYYNRAWRVLQRFETTSNWNYSSTVRQANGSTANQLDIVVGVADEAVAIRVQGSFSNTTVGAWAYLAIGEDAVTASANCTYAIENTPTNGYRFQLTSALYVVPAAGRHYFTWLEATSGDTTGGFYGTNNGNAGITGTWMN